MLGDFLSASQIYLACGKTDMRKSIDGLAALVQQKFKCLKEQNAFLRKNLFGRKSEKANVVFDGQINLFDEAEQEAKKSA